MCQATGNAGFLSCPGCAISYNLIRPCTNSIFTFRAILPFLPTTMYKFNPLLMLFYPFFTTNLRTLISGPQLSCSDPSILFQKKISDNQKVPEFRLRISAGGIEFIDRETQQCSTKYPIEGIYIIVTANSYIKRQIIFLTPF